MSIKILYSTHTSPDYMPPLPMSDQQIIVGPNYPDAVEEKRILSIKVAPGRYDLARLVRRLPETQKPDLTVVLIDSFQQCIPENLAEVPGRRLLLVADTHHGEKPLQKCLAYARQQPFDRIALIHDPHHLHWFTEARIAPTRYIPNVNVAHFPQALNDSRLPQIAFVGQVGQRHRRRTNLLRRIQEAGLPLIVKQIPAPSAASMYASSQISFNCSLNGDLNMRVFEVMAAGGFLVTDRLSPQSGLQEMFERGKHYVDYDNEHDLVDKLKYYLAHPDECLKIALAGQNAYLRDHGPAQRVHELVFFAFDNGAHSYARDQRAIAGSDGFGFDLDSRVLVYEICQKLSLGNETVRVVVDAALGARYISDLVDLPRLKVLVVGAATGLTESLDRLATLNQVELIEGGSGPCDLMLMDVQTIRGWRSMQMISSQQLLVTTTGEINGNQKEWLSAQGFTQMGKNLFAFQNQTVRRNQPCPCGSGKKFKHCHGTIP